MGPFWRRWGVTAAEARQVAAAVVEADLSFSSTLEYDDPRQTRVP